MDNVLLFLTPKSQVKYLLTSFSLRQALEKMKYYRFTSVPLINEEGKYIGTITEGDILWYLINNHENINIEKTSILDIPRTKDHKPITIDKNISDLYELAIIENFIPVVDDSNSFIGIITRKVIIEYLKNKN